MRLFTNTDQSQTPENNSPVRLVEEDALLVQIDEFRKKAEALQSLINDRQEKVLTLEATVQEKEDKNKELQDELSKKQEALNGVLEDLKDQFDILADRVDTSINNALAEANEPVIEKIHSENVRLYRNIYDFVKEDYDKEEFAKSLKEYAKASRGPVRWVLFFTLVNTVLAAFMFLFYFGIIVI